MNLIPVEYRLAARALAWLAAVAVVVAALWWVYSAIWQRGADHVQAEWDKAKAAAVVAAEAERQRKASDIAAIDQLYTEQLQEKQYEIDRLRGDVAAGRARLRIAARCPVPEATGAGVDHADPGRPGAPAGPDRDAYLDPAAEPAYFALKEGLALQRRQLLACQAILK